MTPGWREPRPGHRHIFAIVRVDSPSSDSTFDPDNLVTGTTAYTDRALAIAETERLQAMNADKGSRYVVVIVRLKEAAEPSTSHSNDRSHGDFLAAARKHIRAFTWFGTYPEACALVMGYDNGLGPGSFWPGFQEWLTSRQGSAPEVVFWVHVLREALPESPGLSGRDLTDAEHAAAVDKLFELLLEYIDQADVEADATR